MPRPEAAPNYHQRLTVAEEISERLGAVVGYRIQGEIAGDLVFSKSPDHSEVAFDLAFAPEGGEQRFTC